MTDMVEQLFALTNRRQFGLDVPGPGMGLPQELRVGGGGMIEKTGFLEDGVVNIPQLAAGSVTADKMVVGYNGSGNLLADGDFSWYGLGDTQYWALDTGWSVIAASASTIYEHGRWRARFNDTASGDQHFVSLQKVRMAPHHVFSLAILHIVEAISGGSLAVQVEQYTSGGSFVTTSTLGTFSSTTNMGVDGWVIAGASYVAPTGVTPDLTLDATTDYIIFRLTALSGVTSQWYVMSCAITPGYLPTLSANTGSYYSAVDIGAGGIIIYNGKLVFQDQFGQTAMDGYGFGGSWVKYIHNGVYNGDWAAGSTSDIAVSETGGGSGTANYKASLSSDLPSWVVAASGGTLSLVANSSASGGYMLRSQGSGGSINRWYQDIPVVPGEWPLAQYDWKQTVGASEEFTKTIYFSYRDSTHALIGTRYSSGLAYGPGTTIFDTDTLDLGYILGIAPGNASYVRVEFQITHTTGTTEADFNEVRLAYGNPKLRNLQLLSDTGTGLGESADWALVIGNQNSYEPSVAFGNEGIQARAILDNAGPLYLNWAGGVVNVGSGGIEITNGSLVINATSDYIRIQTNAAHALLIGPKNQTTNVPFRIAPDGKMEWGSGAAARDTNLYRSSSNILKSDDSMYILGHENLFDDLPGGVSQSISTASAWYEVGSNQCYVAITPKYAGQRWILSGHIAYSDNSGLTSVLNDASLRLDTDTSGTLSEFLQVARVQNIGAANSWYSQTFCRVWVAGSTSTVYLKLYVQSNTTGHALTFYGSSGAKYVTSVTAQALP